MSRSFLRMGLGTLSLTIIGFLMEHHIISNRVAVIMAYMCGSAIYFLILEKGVRA